MRQHGLEGRVRRLRRRVHQVSAEGVHAPDLVLRDWNPTRPDRLWVADMTYVSTWQGWLYLGVIMDAYSRRIVGWSLAQHMRTELVQSALDMAVARRRPEAGLVHQTDHGSQYTALTFGHQLRKHGTMTFWCPCPVPPHLVLKSQRCWRLMERLAPAQNERQADRSSGCRLR